MRGKLFGYTLNPERLNNAVPDITGRLAQLDAVSEKKPQAARQSTDKGPDGVSSGRNPWQRVGSRSHNSADVQVQRANILSLLTDPKRLIPLSKKEMQYFGGSPKGLRYGGNNGTAGHHRGGGMRVQELRITLTADQIAEAHRFARLRALPKHRSGDRNYIDGRIETSHVYGLYGEIAYSIATGQPWDRTITGTSGDLTDFDHIEIKTSTWPGADIELKVKQSEYIRKAPRHYILARLLLPEVHFLGCIRRARFDYMKYPRTHRTEPNWCVQADDLARFLPVWIGNRMTVIPFMASSS